MKKEKNNQNKLKIKKLKISKLFYEMSPLYEPKIKLKIIEELFSNKFINNNLSQREKRIDKNTFQTYNLKGLKYVHDFSIGKVPIKKCNANIKIKKTNSPQNNINNLLITSLKTPKYYNKYLKLNINDNKKNNDDNIQFEKINNIKNDYINKFKSNFSSENFENQLLKKTLNKNNINFSLLENNSNYDFNYNKLNYNNSKYYRSNMILPKITKKNIIPSFSYNRSKEIKDLYSLKQYEMKEIEERMKLKPFIYK